MTLPPITLHPGMRFGEPTIDGTRMPVMQAARGYWHGGLAAAGTMDLTDEQVLACLSPSRSGPRVRDYLAGWLKPWRGWRER